MEASRRELIGWVTAAGLVIAGVVVLIVAMSSPPTSFGWFAYAPLSDTTYMPGTSGVTLAASAAGAALIVAGLLATGFLAGLRVGRRGPAGGFDATQTPSR